MDIFRATIGELRDDGDQQALIIDGMAGHQPRAWRVMPHGLASNAPLGAHGVAMALGGRHDRVAFIGGEMADKRPRNVVSGGTVIYDAAGNMASFVMDQGIKVRASTGNSVEIEAHGLKVIMSPGRIDLGGPGGSRVMTESGLSNKVFAIL